jgi:hypothetical protein
MNRKYSSEPTPSVLVIALECMHGPQEFSWLNGELPAGRRQVIKQLIGSGQALGWWISTMKSMHSLIACCWHRLQDEALFYHFHRF